MNSRLMFFNFSVLNSQINILLAHRHDVLRRGGLWRRQSLNRRRFMHSILSICDFHASLLRQYSQNALEIYEICSATYGACDSYALLTPWLHADVHFNENAPIETITSRLW